MLRCPDEARADTVLSQAQRVAQTTPATPDTLAVPVDVLQTIIAARRARLATATDTASAG